LQSWIAAATETFLTWGILGAATMQAASHVSERHHILRQSLVTIVAVLTALAFVACVADACIQILQGSGYQYEHTSSFGKFAMTQKCAAKIYNGCFMFRIDEYYSVHETC
jgi:solute carrier family 6 (neurotransmitter transporter), invertebrate